MNARGKLRSPNNTDAPAPSARRRGPRLAGVALAAACALALAALAAGPAGASIPYPPNDPYFSSQWALRIIKAPQAWTANTGSGAVVAVVDTGVQFGIPDLPTSKSAGSYDCRGHLSSSTPCPTDSSGDDQGHGTWVSSIIAAATNNGQGMAGVAPDAQIMSVKAIGPDGTGTVDDIAKGIEFAADQGAKVINLSVGPDAFGQPFPTLSCPPTTSGGCLSPPVNDSTSLHNALQPAVDYAAAHGALVVVAAGNTDPGAGPGPSLYLGMQHLLIVGATGPNDEVASYSDTGSGSTFVYAPGGDGACSSGDTSNCIILASRAGGYQVSEGTSFATPHVAGVAALLMAQGDSNSAAASQIVNTADHIAAGIRLNAAAALGASQAPLPVTNNQPPSAPAVVHATPAPPVTQRATPKATPKPTPTPKPSPTPSPTPSPSPTPTPSSTPTPDPTTALAAAEAPTPKPSHRALGSPLSSTQSPEVLGLVLFISASGGAAAVWLARRVRV